jgi:hypothetical protein
MGGGRSDPLEIIQTVLAAVSAYAQLVGVAIMVLCYWKRLQEQGEDVEKTYNLPR